MTSKNFFKNELCLQFDSLIEEIFCEIEIKKTNYQRLAEHRERGKI